MALYAILKALGISRGDCVLVPGYTCVVVPSAVHFVGAESLYADIEPQTYNVSGESIEAACSGRARGRIKALVVQHTYGVPANTAPVVAWAEEKGIAVIEDCAHAVGSRYRDGAGEWREVGTLGDAAFFSTQWSKPFTTGLGGWAVSRDPGVARAIRKFHAADCVAPRGAEVLKLALQLVAHHMLVWPPLYWAALTGYRALARRGVLVGSSTEGELGGAMPGDYAKRMCGLQEWVGWRKLAGLGRVLDHRRKLKRLYDDALAAAGVRAFQVPAYADPILLRYPVRVEDKLRVLAEARRQRIELGDWFDHPLHPRGANVVALGWRDGMCPEGERAAREVVNLPMHPRTGQQEVERAVQFIRTYVIGRGAGE